ncbi:MAG: hypothetical protein AAB861_04165, partial [Patescibacteria group bacterium]
MTSFSLATRWTSPSDRSSFGVTPTDKLLPALTSHLNLLPDVRSYLYSNSIFRSDHYLAKNIRFYQHEIVIKP